MAKYYGKIGYSIRQETVPGVWEESIVEKPFCGEQTGVKSKWQTSSHLNDNIDIPNQLSIVADPFAMQYFYNIRYIEYLGCKWEVQSVEIIRPRLILSIGGVYNE
jgi:hypothetical protein